MKKHAFDLSDKNMDKSGAVALKWSEVLESAFDYYYTEYIPAWTLNQTKLNNIGDKIYISKKNGQWVSWESINESDRPDVATLFDLLPDLPEDSKYWQIIKDLKDEGIENPEDHFWENKFSYQSAKEVSIQGHIYKIEWEA